MKNAALAARNAHPNRDLRHVSGWDSHTTLQANAWQGKYQKMAWSKIVGIDTSTMERPGGRLDPAGLPTSDELDRRLRAGSRSRTQ